MSITLFYVDPDWVSPRSDLIDNYPERSMYPAAPLVRNKRIAIDELTKNTLANSQSHILNYVDPILAELDFGKQSNRILKNNCSQKRNMKCPKVQLLNELEIVDNTIGFIDSQIKSNSASIPKYNLLNTGQMKNEKH